MEGWLHAQVFTQEQYDEMKANGTISDEVMPIVLSEDELTEVIKHKMDQKTNKGAF